MISIPYRTPQKEPQPSSHRTSSQNLLRPCLLLIPAMSAKKLRRNFQKRIPTTAHHEFCMTEKASLETKSSFFVLCRGHNAHTGMRKGKREKSLDNDD